MLPAVIAVRLGAPERRAGQRRAATRRARTGRYQCEGDYKLKFSRVFRESPGGVENRKDATLRAEVIKLLQEKISEVDTAGRVEGLQLFLAARAAIGVKPWRSPCSTGTLARALTVLRAEAG